MSDLMRHLVLFGWLCLCLGILIGWVWQKCRVERRDRQWQNRITYMANETIRVIKEWRE